MSMGDSSVIGNTGGYSYDQHNRSSVMNSETMPSAEAGYARSRTAEIMDALRNGKPGGADKMLGKAPPKYRKPPKYSEEGGVESASSASASADADVAEGMMGGDGEGELVSRPEGKAEKKSGLGWFKGKFNVKGKADDGVIR